MRLSTGEYRRPLFHIVSVDALWICLVNSVRSGQIRNPESARVSMVGQIRKEIPNNLKNNFEPTNSTELGSILQTKIIEEDEEMADEGTARGVIEQHVQISSFDKFKPPQV
jgi:hypothetical protein